MVVVGVGMVDVGVMVVVIIEGATVVLVLVRKYSNFCANI